MDGVHLRRHSRREMSELDLYVSHYSEVHFQTADFAIVKGGGWNAATMKAAAAWGWNGATMRAELEHEATKQDMSRCSTPTSPTDRKAKKGLYA